jgi:hypothetical protein
LSRDQSVSEKAWALWHASESALVVIASIDLSAPTLAVVLAEALRTSLRYDDVRADPLTCETTVARPIGSASNSCLVASPRELFAFSITPRRATRRARTGGRQPSSDRVISRPAILPGGKIAVAERVVERNTPAHPHPDFNPEKETA